MTSRKNRGVKIARTLAAAVAGSALFAGAAGATTPIDETTPTTSSVRLVVALPTSVPSQGVRAIRIDAVPPSPCRSGGEPACVDAVPNVLQIGFESVPPSPCRAAVGCTDLVPGLAQLRLG